MVKEKESMKDEEFIEELQKGKRAYTHGTTM
jgi:hypothetical protein